jgi:uncharacterized protein
MFKVLGLAALLAGLLSSAVYAKEEVVSFIVDGKKVVGTLNTPDGVTSPPVVLLLHGFTGKRDELAVPSLDNEGIFKHAAKIWATKGLASLRIDFFGSGDSEGAYEDTTLQIEIADALGALDFLAARPDVDFKRVSVVGWSMGGAVAAATAGRSKYPLTSVSLWAPANSMAASLALLISSDFLRQGLAAGDKAVEGKLPWGATVKLKGPYFKSIFEVDPVAEITAYHGPLLVAVGTKDPIVFPQPESGQAFITYHKGPSELWVQPMDHSFNSFENRDTVDAIINKTADFIQSHLK